MFPEFRDLITKLKVEDAYFANLFDKHNELDQRIKNIESNIELRTLWGGAAAGCEIGS